MKQKLSIFIIFLILLVVPLYALPPSPPSNQVPVVLDTNCNQSKYYGLGKLCQDTDDDLLYIGTGAAVSQVLHGTTGYTIGGFTASKRLESDGSGNATTDSGTLDFATTGTIQGGIKISSDADGMTGAEMTTAGVRGTLFLATGSGTWTLPTAVSGMNLCLMDTGTAHDLILDVQAADTLMFNGTEDSAGDGITNASGSSTGDKICVVAYAAGKWIVTSSQGTWVAQ